MKDKKRPPSIKPLARERIAVLFSQAEKVYHEHPGYSTGKSPLPGRSPCASGQDRTANRHRFCHHCYRYMVPGVNMRVRVHHGWVAVTCLECKKTTRYRVERSHDHKD